MNSEGLSERKIVMSSDKKDANARDRDEVKQKRDEYSAFADWKDRGILHDLSQIHHINKPTQSLLLKTAMILARFHNVPLDRQDKRRKEVLIGWFNQHYDIFKDTIPKLAMKDKKGGFDGPNREAWKDFRRQNPDHPAVVQIPGNI
jgi:hypothetical protein